MRLSERRAQYGEDPEVAALAEATRLESLARQIDETHEEDEASGAGHQRH